MTRPGPQSAFAFPHKRISLRRMGAGGRMLAGYVTFFTIALLIFDAMILLSLLP